VLSSQPGIALGAGIIIGVVRDVAMRRPFTQPRGGARNP
jgi:hypothetical protein